MDYTYEIIPTSSRLPLHIFFHNVRYVPNHWHDSLELLFVLKGSAMITVQNKPYSLSEEDLILINSNDIHSIQADQDNLLLALQIPDTFLKEQGVDTEHTVFSCHSFGYGPGEQEAFDGIRRLLSSIMWVHTKAGYGYEVKLRSLLLELIYLLLRRFRGAEKARENPINKRMMERLLKLNEYIQSHYQEPLTLNELAEREGFSVTYLSSFFQKSMGVSFRAYITQIRLEHAVTELLSSEEPIIEIALRHGFPSLKSFHKAFKDAYDTTPAEYRRSQKPAGAPERDPAGNGTGYLAYDRDNAFVSLFKYLPSEAPKEGGAGAAAERNVVHKEVGIRLPSAGKGQLLKHTWRNLCTVGKAKEILYAGVQEHLKMLQEAVGFRYIRFHGIFDDEMMVYRQGEDGRPVFSFTYVDQLIDFLLGIGLRPFFELGFMPGGLADRSQTVFHKPSYISLPQHPEHWKALLEAFARHLLRRYGAAEVRAWYFEFWNEPDMHVFWKESRELYFAFYEESFRALKEVSPELRLGGPGVISDPEGKAEWLRSYWAYCAERDCRPDFITFHVYPVMPVEGTWGEGKPPEDIEYAGASYLADTLRGTKKALAGMGAGDFELHVTEWNSTSHHRELTNDTSFKAAYLAKSISESLDEVDSLGYWTATDLLEELPLPVSTFHGGLGLITNNGIRKPGFHVYGLLAGLGDRLVERGEGYCLTSSADGAYQLLVYNYCHFDRLYMRNDTSAIDSHNRYGVFADTGRLELTVKLEGLPAGKVEIRSRSVSREQGSAYDLWLDMGAPEELTPADIRYLDSGSLPRQQVKVVEASDGLTVKCSLSSHEVQLLCIRPVWTGR
ncbi:GH39 family glycosyl hydrolase [Paenibacillus caseinilyticus]|uniref:Xylan 1,4-beta-xylosidase n=1 Tax=Paenibacillus mucilaginosus K02 TaxID=997761 RepID=I0BEI6_9BACL|nr:helix-turn-helix domain-containing protein [Paenibacillus mucilaginosus]AFH60783.1 xylan 1,4-beta-xylosidase [Paenibacillus mucilaginosus K02]